MKKKVNKIEIDGVFQADLSNYPLDKWNVLTTILQGEEYLIELEYIGIVPYEISQINLRKQLILNNISIKSIDALIQTLPNPDRELIYTMWEYAVVFDRDSEELNQMAQMLGVTSEKLDELFINGNKL
ncbi:hypothetical protein [uncultured Flavobacterium sp.]|uniref:hypothetical protein n=1 Tax=uncultured Flavobacterium sp. TaxID=165435 RepID=UPI0030ED1D47|tara:strand:+ start:68 stop:451 length:384 start_codon:yes stop_codon:yes gene_type:complete